MDAGNSFGGFRDGSLVALPQKDFGIIPLRSSVGLGAVAYTSYGPVRVELIKILDPQFGGEDGLQLYFSYGAPF